MRIRCLRHISLQINPQLFYEVLGELDDIKPNCLWNLEAVEQWKEVED